MILKSYSNCGVMVPTLQDKTVLNVREIIKNFKLDDEYGDGECSVPGAVLLYAMNPPDDVKPYYSHPQSDFLAEVIATRLNTVVGEQLLIDKCNQLIDLCKNKKSHAAIALMQWILECKE